MTLYYEAAFGVNASALSTTCTIAGNVATIGTGYYSHQGMGTITGLGSVTAFSAAAASAFTTAGGGPWTVTYSFSTHAYTISRATNFTLVFSSSASDTRLAAALGFAIGSYSGAASFTSNVRPYYVIVPYELARSASLPFVYEPDDIVEEAVSDSGTPYSIAKNTNELWSDWMQTMEQRSACFDFNASTAAPWTWQMFFKHTRGQYPFAVYESALFNAIYKSRAEAARFKVSPVTSDLDTIYNVAFKTRTLGRLAPNNSIAGTVSIGSVLTVTEDATVTSRQWQRSDAFGQSGSGSWANIGGATSTTYTCVVADIGYGIRCVSTGPDGSATSNTLRYLYSTVSAVLEAWEFRGLTPGAISTWTGAKNGVVLAAGATKQPVASATSFNSTPGLAFDGVNDCIRIASTAMFAAYQDVRIVFGVLDQSAGTPSVVVELTSDTTTQAHAFAVSPKNGGGVISGASSAGGAVGLVDAAASLGSASIVSFGISTAVVSAGTFIRQAAASLALTVDASGCTPAANFATDALNIGSRNDGASAPFHGVLGGALLFLSGPTANADLLDAEAYAKNGAGL